MSYYDPYSGEPELKIDFYPGTNPVHVGVVFLGDSVGIAVVERRDCKKVDPEKADPEEKVERAADGYYILFKEHKQILRHYKEFVLNDTKYQIVRNHIKNLSKSFSPRKIKIDVTHLFGSKLKDDLTSRVEGIELQDDILERMMLDLKVKLEDGSIIIPKSFENSRFENISSNDVLVKAVALASFNIEHELTDAFALG